MNQTIKIAAILGALAVALGAFGAHGLKSRLDPSDLQVYQTGVTYQVYHVLALLAVGILQRNGENKFLNWSAILFTVGIILFSGSLYALTFFKLFHLGAYGFVGAITPFGGLMFIAGWLCLLPAMNKRSA
jgi:uncharacterized membrane protein YgdD (TMEM256/DUF423 family)